jgi:hypothetical protein
MLQHSLGVGIGDEEGDVISLEDMSAFVDLLSDEKGLTCTGFLRNTIKLSALCIMNRVN